MSEPSLREGRGPVTGEDGKPRCPWAESSAMMRAYHDEEWGRRVDDERGLFERLALEGFQAGLSWATILRRRPAFRQAFADFDPAAVATFTPTDVERLMGDASIIRNRRKIEATVTNARAVLALDGGFPELVWTHERERPHAPHSTADIGPTSRQSVALSRALKQQGFTFVGPTTCLSLMQAVGIVNDHLAGCWVRDQLT